MSQAMLDNNSNRPQAEMAIAPRHKALANNLDRRFDFIVCGAGASGSVIAGRLAANPDVKVLLLEAGESDELELVMDPTLWVRTIGSEMDWGFVAARNSQLNGRAIPYSMGKVLGGSSSMNVSTWSRGHRADWDAYAAETGDAAWGYEAVLDAYRRRIEDWKGSPDPDYRGSGGPMHVQPAPDLHPFFSALLEAAEANGFQRFENPNGRMMEADGGCAPVDEIIKDGRRQSVFRSYAHARLNQANLTVLTRALVTRIVFNGNRAAGVEVFRWRAASLRSRAGSHRFSRRHPDPETPDAIRRRRSGGAGEVRHSRRARPAGRGAKSSRSRRVGLRLGRDGKAAAEGAEESGGMLLEISVGARRAELLPLRKSGTGHNAENQLRFRSSESSWSLFVGMRPASRGAVRLTGPGPSDPLDIQANYLADPRDLEDLKIGIARAREIGNAAPLRPYARGEEAPGRLDQASLEQFIRNGLVTFWHQCGTAKMGRDGMSVVDSALKVYGVQGLRVADGSVLPRVTTGNTMAPCVVIGERAAAMLQDEHGASSMAQIAK